MTRKAKSRLYHLKRPALPLERLLLEEVVDHRVGVISPNPMCSDVLRGRDENGLLRNQGMSLEPGGVSHRKEIASTTNTEAFCNSGAGIRFDGL